MSCSRALTCAASGQLVSTRVLEAPRDQRNGAHSEEAPRTFAPLIDHQPIVTCNPLDNTAGPADGTVTH